MEIICPYYFHVFIIFLMFKRVIKWKLCLNQYQQRPEIWFVHLIGCPFSYLQLNVTKRQWKCTHEKQIHGIHSTVAIHTLVKDSFYLFIIIPLVILYWIFSIVKVYLLIYLFFLLSWYFIKESKMSLFSWILLLIWYFHLFSNFIITFSYPNSCDGSNY